jgi:Rod binding domain-containing protein
MSDATSLGVGSYGTILTPNLALPSVSNTQAGKHDTPEATAKAASQFEALLIGQFLKSAREAGGSGWMGTDTEDADAGMIELAEQQLSQALATRGGFGLAKLVAEGLTKTENISHEETTSQK